MYFHLWEQSHASCLLVRSTLKIRVRSSRLIQDNPSRVEQLAVTHRRTAARSVLHACCPPVQGTRNQAHLPAPQGMHIFYLRCVESNILASDSESTSDKLFLVYKSL